MDSVRHKRACPPPTVSSLESRHNDTQLHSNDLYSRYARTDLDQTRSTGTALEFMAMLSELRLLSDSLNEIPGRGQGDG